ncbi:hypothetical protein GALL_436390 [mine drainage metagenome]|uniref:Uncharacterized protein n=1 Tax=mine drainage metagenome TaxID=410659 RepID=A0A1J5PSW6_9ZZZZ
MRIGKYLTTTLAGAAISVGGLMSATDRAQADDFTKLLAGAAAVAIIAGAVNGRPEPRHERVFYTEPPQPEYVYGEPARPRYVYVERQPRRYFYSDDEDQ